MRHLSHAPFDDTPLTNMNAGNFSPNSLEDIYRFFSNNEKEIVQCLQAEKLLLPLKRCGNKKCRRMQTLEKNARYKGHYAACCKTCKKFSSTTPGTFFEGTNLAFKDIFIALWLWACHISPTDSSKFTGIMKEAFVQYFRYFRDIASWKLLELPTKELGGPDHVVQIDESVIAKRKYHRGKRVKEQWVLGMYDTSAKEGVVLYVVKRNKQTLFPLIQTHVAPGTTIWTDQWAAFNGLSDCGYKHHTVNHSKEFKSSEGVCTNQVEGYWGKLKKFLHHTNVLWSTLLPEHIDEFMWRDKFRGNPAFQFQHILEHRENTGNLS